MGSDPAAQRMRLSVEREVRKELQSAFSGYRVQHLVVSEIENAKLDGKSTVKSISFCVRLTTVGENS